jgi:hypothetical protein
LVLDEHRFGHHGTGAAGTGEPGDCRQKMQEQDGQIAHRTMLPSSQHGRRMLRNFEFATHAVAFADLSHVGWVSHCRDLVQLPVAA